MHDKSEMCRSCLSENGDLQNISNFFDEIDELTFSAVFTIITNIKIEENDSLPHFICNECIIKLKISHDFRKRSEISNIYLRLKLKKEENYSDGSGNEMFTGFPDNFVEETIIPHTEEEEFLISVPMPAQTIKPPNIRIKTRNKTKSRKKINSTQYSNKHFNLDNVNSKESSDDDDEVPLSEFCNIDNEQKKTIEKKKDKDIIDAKGYFKCPQCYKTYKLTATLEKHIETVHKGKTLHLCNICGKSCAQESSLKTHLLMHQGLRPYKCDRCDKSYFTKNGLQTHEYSHINDKKPVAKFLCSICGKGFTTNQRLRIHNYVHTGERNFACDICNKAFATEFRLRSHNRIHTGEKPYQCQECGLRFAQGNALKCHKRIHTGERPYECKICLKTFSQNTVLKTHMTLHTGKTVKCPDCDKKFSRASYLILHKREHTGEKPYACDKCPNRYKQKSHLDRHMDTHNGVKHKCSICSKEYSKQWSLKMHMFSHTNEKPYKCLECPTAFIRKDKYKAHLKSHDDKQQIIMQLEPNQYEINMNDIDENVEIIESAIVEIVDDNIDGIHNEIKHSPSQY